MKAALGITFGALVAVVAACSSSSTDPGTGDAGTSGSSGTSGGTSGTSGTSGGTSGTSGGTSGTSGGTSGTSGGGVDAGFDGGFDLVFTGGGTNILQQDFRLAPVSGSTCQGTNPNRRCGFTGSITIPSTGCFLILNVSFVGEVKAGASYGFVVDPTTPPGKGLVSYTEICGATTKMWKATGGSGIIDVINAPAPGLATGTMSFSVNAATMAPAPTGAGPASGSFTVSGKGTNVSYLSSN